MMDSFTLSGFSDEIDERVDVQFSHLKKLGISYFEPRGIDGKNISELSFEEARALKKNMDSRGMKASSIGSPIGKIMITDDFAPHLALFRHVLEIAKILDCRYIRIFSFFIPQGDEPSLYRDAVLSRLKTLVGLAQEKNMILLHENEKNIYGDTAARCADLFSAIPSPCFQAVFDPANFIQCGQTPYPDAFDRLRPHIAYVHIKDALPDGSVVPAGLGRGEIKMILKSLKNSGYKGFLSLEPHLGSFSGLENLELDDAMINLPNSSPEKFTLAYQALKKILEDI